MTTERTYGILERLGNGLVKENPIFKLALSMCPAVAMTNSVRNGFLLEIGRASCRERV